MNIFVLDDCPQTAAEYACDKHVVKMILESAQMLCSAFPKNSAPYKRTHYNHPCTKWSRASRENYEWLIDHAFALSDEYTLRYKKTHKTLAVLEWCHQNSRLLGFQEQGLTSFAQCMPEAYQCPEDAVTAYRKFYKAEKAHMATWSKLDNTPAWW